MNPIHAIRRAAGILAWLAGVLLALAAAAPAALASGPGPLPPGWNMHPPLPLGHVAGPVYTAPTHTAVAGGMPGWQITLIAAAAVLLATAVAVALYRIRSARRRMTASAA